MVLFLALAHGRHPVFGDRAKEYEYGVAEFEAWPHFVTTGSPSLSLGFLSGSGIIMLSSL